MALFRCGGKGSQNWQTVTTTITGTTRVDSTTGNTCDTGVVLFNKPLRHITNCHFKGSMEHVAYTGGGTLYFILNDDTQVQMAHGDMYGGPSIYSFDISVQTDTTTQYKGYRITGSRSGGNATFIYTMNINAYEQRI